ncbi:MAG: pyridoxal phosphate-dependent aminotransferase [Salinivirgaceae bacterium]|jgi:aspartate/methionine/tyrosine aminotransferase|nr:pyridoxal phosphate-dependent aminotransferase [Salinivirgaceae bacterium]
MEKPEGSLISFMANKVKSEGGINLAQGIPSFDPPKELLKLLEGCIYDNIHQYAPGKGNYKLLQQLELHYKIPSQQFLIVNGATEAISLLFTYLLKLLGHDFTVLSFDPVYESYKHLPRIFNLPFVSYAHKKDESIDFAELKNLIILEGVKLILLASPGNPVGKVWTKREVNTLVELCIKHKVYLVFDAVYSDLYFHEPPYFPLEKQCEYVFYVNAFSKKLSITGWRVGYLITHPSHMSNILDVHDYTGLCAPSILQQAIADYLEQNDFGKAYTKELREKLKQNYNLLSNELVKLGFKVYDAQGGYFIWAELPENFKSGLDFALNLYEQEEVAIVPGIHFSENGERIVRINIARHQKEIETALERMKRFIEMSK